jgi:IclR family acetate operon transcriptional repressor
MEMKQVSQVIDLLEFFAANARPATLAEISRRLGWPKSSAFKLLATLSARGFLYEPYGRGMYYPSPRWAVVIDAIARSEPVPDSLKELLRILADRTGETAVLASISGVNAFFVEAIEPQNPVRYTAQVGKTVPLHATAVGKALLVQLSYADRRALLAKISYTRFTPSTSMSADEVEMAIDRGTKRGYFEGQNELNEDLGGVALPLHYPGRPLAVMVAGPLYRIAPRYREIVKLIRLNIAALDSVSVAAPARS